MSSSRPASKIRSAALEALEADLVDLMGFKIFQDEVGLEVRLLETFLKNLRNFLVVDRHGGKKVNKPRKREKTL